MIISIHKKNNSNAFKMLYNTFWRICKYKFLELQLYYSDWNWIIIVLELNITGDHPGVNIEFGCLGLSLNVHYYDSRHAKDIIKYD